LESSSADNKSVAAAYAKEQNHAITFPRTRSDKRNLGSSFLLPFTNAAYYYREAANNGTDTSGGGDCMNFDLTYCAVSGMNCCIPFVNLEYALHGCCDLFLFLRLCGTACNLPKPPSFNLSSSPLHHGSIQLSTHLVLLIIGNFGLLPLVAKRHRHRYSLWCCQGRVRKTTTPSALAVGKISFSFVMK